MKFIEEKILYKLSFFLEIKARSAYVQRGRKIKHTHMYIYVYTDYVTNNTIRSKSKIKGGKLARLFDL